MTKSTVPRPERSLALGDLGGKNRFQNKQISSTNLKNLRIETEKLTKYTMNKLLTTLTIASAIAYAPMIAFPQNALAITASITNSRAIDLTYTQIAGSSPYTHTFTVGLGAGQSFSGSTSTDDLVLPILLE